MKKLIKVLVTLVWPLLTAIWMVLYFLANQSIDHWKENAEMWRSYYYDCVGVEIYEKGDTTFIQPKDDWNDNENKIFDERVFKVKGCAEYDTIWIDDNKYYLRVDSLCNKTYHIWWMVYKTDSVHAIIH